MDSKKVVNNNKQKTFLTKKEKENIRKGVIEEINDDLRKELCDSIMSDINDRINDDYKDNLKETISNELIVDIKESIKADEKRLSRSKSFKIARLYIYILLLIACSLFLVYRLYVTGNLDVIKEIKTDIPTTTTTQEVKDLKWYMNKYGNILDNIKIDNVELLKGNYDFNKVDIKDKLAMAYKNLSDEQIAKDGMIYTVKDEDLKTSYKNIFGTENGYVSTSFKVDKVNFAYSSTNASYISIVNENISGNDIKMEIIDIKGSDEVLEVTAIIALVKDNKIYNINDLNTEIKAYNSGESLKTIENSLSKSTFTFKKIDNNYYINTVSVN